MWDMKIEIVEKERVFSGFAKLDDYRFRHSLFQGGMSDEISRELCHKGHFSLVLLYDPSGDQVLLTEQVRIGVHAAQEQGVYPRDKSPWLVEAVAGGIDAGETPEDAARREAKEESGCVVRELHYLGQTFTSPGSLSELAFLYLGIIDPPDVGIHGHVEEGENIRTFLVPAEEAIRMVYDGKVVNSTSMLALLLFEKLRGQPGFLSP